jgi:hypothetical protein
MTNFFHSIRTFAPFNCSFKHNNLARHQNYLKLCMTTEYSHTFLKNMSNLLNWTSSLNKETTLSILHFCDVHLQRNNKTSYSFH